MPVTASKYCPQRYCTTKNRRELKTVTQDGRPCHFQRQLRYRVQQNSVRHVPLVVGTCSADSTDYPQHEYSRVPGYLEYGHFQNITVTLMDFYARRSSEVMAGQMFGFSVNYPIKTFEGGSGSQVLGRVCKARFCSSRCRFKLCQRTPRPGHLTCLQAGSRLSSKEQSSAET